MRRGGKSLFSLTTVFASFFGAALIAGAYAYFNYKFSKYKFIDFKQFIFYEASDIFKPSKERYIVIFFSSKEPDAAKKIASLHFKTPILAIDYYNNKIQSKGNLFFLRSGTNTTLKFIHRFNIYDVPVIFVIKRVHTTLYKQDSMLRKLDTIDQLASNTPKEEEL